MKFSVSLIIATASALFFTAAPLQACEQDCRDGIALAFCNKYKIEWDPLFDALGTDLKSNLYKSLDVNKLAGNSTNATKLKSAVNAAVTKQVDKLQADYTKNCQAIVLDSIFLHEPKFKGQCQRPLRVIQPPVGVAWQLSDCDNQNYVCGNPPAICHFMDKYVKPRNLELLNSALSGRCSVDGDFTKTIADVGEDAATKTGVFKGSQSKLSTFMDAVKKNLGAQLSAFVSTFKNGVCFTNVNGTSCDKYDAEIKTILLSFP